MLSKVISINFKNKKSPRTYAYIYIIESELSSTTTYEKNYDKSCKKKNNWEA